MVASAEAIVAAAVVAEAVVVRIKAIKAGVKAGREAKAKAAVVVVPVAVAFAAGVDRPRFTVLCAEKNPRGVIELENN